MKRKFLAKILAVSMVFTAAPGIGVDASAEELSTGSQKENITLPIGKDLGNLKLGLEPELDFTEGGWFEHYSEGIEITEQGVSVSFKNTTSGTEPFHSPLYLVYSSNDGKIGAEAENYKDYYCFRSDNFGWGLSGSVGEIVYKTAKFPESNDWLADFTKSNQEGLDYVISAVKVNDTVLMKIDSDNKTGKGLVTYAAVPIEAGSKPHFALTGEVCKLSDVKFDNYIDFIEETPEEVKSVAYGETLIGKGAGDWSVKSKTYPIVNGNVDIYVDYSGKNKDTDIGSFGVEIKDSNNTYINTESDGNRWYNPATDAAIIANIENSNIEDGHQYKISVVRELDNTFIITYTDVADGSKYAEFIAPNTSLTEDVTVCIPVHVGTFRVGTSQFEDSNFKVGNLYTSQAWWSGTGVTENQVLSGDGEVSWYIGYYENIGNERGAFSAELMAEKDGLKYFITTGSDVNAWYASEPAGTTHTEGDKITGVALDSKKIELGHKYKVTVKRAGQDFTITYFDLDTNSVYAEFVAANTTFPEGDVNVHIMAQVGKYKIEKEQFDVMPEVKDNSKPLAPYPVVLPTPEPLPTLPPVDENATPEPTPVLEPETITGTEWWAATNGRSRDYVLSGAGSMDLYVTFESTSDSNGYGAFNVELVSDGNKYITTGSDINAWTAEEGKGTISGAVNTGSVIIPGHVYKITVKRTNYDFTITYYDLTDNKKYCTMEVKDTNQGIDVNVHVMAQVGKYIVSQEAPDVVAPSESATPAPSADPEVTPDPEATAEPGSTEAPGTTDPGTNPGDKDPGTTDPGTNNPDSEKPSDGDNENEDKETKKTMKVSDITAKAGKKKVTGKLSVKGTKVTVKVGNKKYKNAKVNGKKFTFTASSKLKKGTKVTIKVTKSGYKAVTKTVKVK